MSVFTAESGYQGKLSVKQRSIKALIAALDDWQSSCKTFEEDMELEFTDGARIRSEEYDKKTARLYAGDFFALINAPIVAGIVETLVDIARDLKVLWSDVLQHAATCAPYCDAYFTDKAMANLMEDDRVAVEATYGCKVFSSKSMERFNQWCDSVKSNVAAQHAEHLTWAYERCRKNPG